MRRFLALALLVAPTAAQDRVWVVDAAGGGDFQKIQPALNAAAAGDLVLVRSGSYPGFTLANESVDLVGDGPKRPQVTGPVSVQGVPDDTVLAWLELRDGLVLYDCAGTVLIQDAELVSTKPYFGAGDDATHRVLSCKDVVFSACSIQGRPGAYTGDCDFGYPGQHALRVEFSKVTLHGGRVEGGAGGVMGCCHYATNTAEDGGDGLVLGQSAWAYGEGVQLVGGAAGVHQCFSSYGGSDGQPLVVSGSSTWVDTTHQVLELELASVLRVNETATLRVRGPSHANAFLVSSDAAAFRFLGPGVGLLHAASPLAISPLGSLGSSGTLTTTFVPPPPSAGADFGRQFLQVFVDVPGSGRFLGPARGLLVLDPAF